MVAKKGAFYSAASAFHSTDIAYILSIRGLEISIKLRTENTSKIMINRGWNLDISAPGAIPGSKRVLETVRDTYLDDFSVVEGGLFDLELGTSHCLVTEEGAHRFFGCVLVSLNTLLDFGFLGFSSLCGLCSGSSLLLSYR